MHLELTHKHVPFTGGSKGIGLAWARNFLAEGARLTLVSRAQENLLAAQSALLKDAPGAAVNIVGSGGKVAAVTHLAGGVANAALMLDSAGFAAAYAGKGVRVNAVNPGLMLTERLHEGM